MQVKGLQRINDGPSDLEALRAALAKKIRFNPERKLRLQPFAEDKLEVQTKEKKQAQPKSFLNKIVTERSTSKKKQCDLHHFMHAKQDKQFEKRKNSLFETSSNADANATGGNLYPETKPATSFFAKLEQSRIQEGQNGVELSFFGRKLNDQKPAVGESDNVKSYFMSSSEALAERLKPKKFKIKLMGSNAVEREMRLYKDTEIGLACSFQCVPKGMVNFRLL